MPDVFQLEVTTGPHSNQPVYSVPSENPESAIICVHGRGATAEPMLEIGQVALPNAWILAPQAAEYTWYPKRFLETQNTNEPWLSSALQVIDELLEKLALQNVQPEQVVLAGFSQGACLVAEYVKRHPQKYQGVVLMSGGLIGSDAEVEDNCLGELDSTPVYIGSDIADSHIPWQRVLQTAACFESLGAKVTFEQYQDFGHTIHPHALSYISSL